MLILHSRPLTHTIYIPSMDREVSVVMSVVCMKGSIYYVHDETI